MFYYFCGPCLLLDFRVLVGLNHRSIGSSLTGVNGFEETVPFKSLVDNFVVFDLHSLWTASHLLLFFSYSHKACFCKPAAVCLLISVKRWSLYPLFGKTSGSYCQYWLDFGFASFCLLFDCYRIVKNHLVSPPAGAREEAERASAGSISEEETVNTTED